MIIDISDLLQRKKDTIPFEFSITSESIERDDFKLTLKSPLKVSGNAYYDGEIISTKGNIDAVTEAQCSRCLKSFDYGIHTGFEEDFSKQGAKEDTYPILNNEIDLYDMVIDVIILSMPLKMLCTEECMGLCPVCGSNLNEKDCGCQKDDSDPRFAVLKGLFKGD
jgi:uncharacterized protein